jgi:hypothetical protein
MTEFEDGIVSVYIMIDNFKTDVKIFQEINQLEYDLFMSGIVPGIYWDACTIEPAENIDEADVIVIPMTWMSNPEQVEIVRKYKDTHRMLINIGATFPEGYNPKEHEHHPCVARDLLYANIPELDESVKSEISDNNDTENFADTFTLYDTENDNKEWHIRFNPNVDAFLHGVDIYNESHRAK